MALTHSLSSIEMLVRSKYAFVLESRISISRSEESWSLTPCMPCSTLNLKYRLSAMSERPCVSRTNRSASCWASVDIRIRDFKLLVRPPVRWDVDSNPVPMLTRQHTGSPGHIFVASLTSSRTGLLIRSAPSTKTAREFSNTTGSKYRGAAVVARAASHK